MGLIALDIAFLCFVPCSNVPTPACVLPNPNLEGSIEWNTNNLNNPQFGNLSLQALSFLFHCILNFTTFCFVLDCSAPRGFQCSRLVFMFAPVT